MAVNESDILDDVKDARAAQEILRDAMTSDKWKGTNRILAAGFLFLASEIRDIFWLLDEIKNGK